MALRPLMVLGCSSNAGKSLLVTGLCRWFARRGVDVAPFKAQNMSNNARVVDGGEIGVAQWLQARAAGVEPTVDMNPVLLKPEADTRSQVVVQGVARPDLTAMPWRERGPSLWPPIVASYARIAASHDLVVLEGAGSPAEVNLADLVNNRMTAHADATAILVADIDRGGAFAHLVGTWTLVPDSTRERLGGFVLNKFRGDASLLEPAPSFVTERTGMHCVGVVPMLDHDLPDEEGGSLRGTPPDEAPRVVIVRYPYASNLDEWHLLPHAADVRWATSPADLDGCDVVILPGSKHVAADLGWMRHRGIDAAVRAAAAGGARVVGVCGGAMIAGTRIDDPHGVEGGGAIDGLAMISLSTEMAATKLTTATRVSFRAAPGPWAPLDGLEVRGYEIRHGVVTGDAPAVGPGVWADGGVLVTTVHGLFEDPDVVAAVLGRRPDPVLGRTFDRLADAIDEHLDTAYLRRVVGW
jgi:adenosylcobyric acid synthase